MCFGYCWPATVLARPWYDLITARDQEDQPGRTRFRVYIFINLICKRRPKISLVSFQLQDTVRTPTSLLPTVIWKNCKRKWDQTRLQTPDVQTMLLATLVSCCFVWRSSSRLLVVVVVDYCGSCRIMTIIIERVCVLSVNRQRPGKRPVTSEISCVQVEVAKGSLTGIQSAVRSSTLGRADLPFGLFVPVLSSLRIAAIIQDLSKLPNIWLATIQQQYSVVHPYSLLLLTVVFFLAKFCKILTSKIKRNILSQTPFQIYI